MISVFGNRKTWLAAVVFAAVLAVHFLWSGFFPETDAAQADWVEARQQTPWLRSYIENGDFWMGYSVALPMAFASVMFARFITNRASHNKNAAVGGMTVSGVLAVAGCFLVGCCGSPMLIIWAGLFGVAFLPFAKPLVAAFTTATILAIWLWANRIQKKTDPNPSCRKSPATGH